MTLANAALAFPSEFMRFAHPLDYLGQDGGGGVGSGPGTAIGAALALKDSGRISLSVIGDGDFMMGNQAIWTAAHMGIPMILVIANNRVYMNDVAHQERMAVVRGRPVENKYVGQQLDHPAIDLVAIARAQGWEGERAENARDLGAALLRGESVWRAGRPYFIEAVIDPNLEQGRGGHTEGRKEA